MMIALRRNTIIPNQQIPRPIVMQANASAHSELSASISSRSSANSLNLEIGMSGSILTDLLQNYLKDDKVADNLM